jgi:predicted outer membrane protein
MGRQEEITMDLIKCLLQCLAIAAVIAPTTGLAQSPGPENAVIGRPHKQKIPVDPAGPQTVGDPITVADAGQELDGANGLNSSTSFSIDQFLAGRLWDANESEIVINEMAANRSHHPQVKEYAEQIVDELRSLSRQLQPLATPEAARATPNMGARKTVSAPDTAASPDKLAELRSQRPNGSDIDQESAKRHPLLETNPSGPSNAFAEVTLPASAERPNPEADWHDPAEPRSPQEDSYQYINQLTDMERRIREGFAKRLRAELEQQTGDDFDASYLQAQVVLQVEAIATAEAIQQQSSGSLGRIAQQAAAMAERHLKQAEQLLQERAGNTSKSPK